MNTDRRHIGRLAISLLLECSHSGLIGDDAHITVTNALHHLQTQEYWQLQTQSRHEGKNDSTDQQLKICRVALPALERAIAAWDNDDFDTVIEEIALAVETDGRTPRKRRKK